MTLRFSAYLKARWAGCVSGILSFAILVPIARLDPDLHHDGIMSSAAIAVSDLQIPHIDFFGQYGPVSPVLQSLLIIVGVPAVLALRLMNALFISMSIFLLVDLGRAAPRSWGISRMSTFLAALVWLVLADFFVGVPMLPWSSVISSFGVLLSVYLITVGVRRQEEVQGENAREMFVGAGAVAALLLFTRLTVGAVFLIVIVSCLVLLGRSSTHPRYRQFARWFIYGALGTIGAQVTLLMLTGSLTEWFQQSVAWPLKWRSGAEEAFQPLAGLSGSVGKTQLEIVLALAVGMSVLLLRNASLSDRVSSRVNFALSLTAVIVGTLIGVRLYSTGSDDTSLGLSVVSAGIDYSTRGRQNLALLFVLVAAGTMIGVAALVVLCTQRWSETFLAEHFGFALFGSAAIATMSQVWPVPDSRHLWWGAALPILALTTWLGSHQRTSAVLTLFLSVPVIFASLVAFSITRSYIALPRFEGPVDTALEGMRVGHSPAGPIDAAELGDALSALKSIVGDDKAIFISNDGFWAGFDDSFHSLDRSYVFWGPVDPIETRLADATTVVIDLALRPYFAEQLSLLEFELVADRGPLAFYKRS